MMISWMGSNSSARSSCSMEFTPKLLKCLSRSMMFFQNMVITKKMCGKRQSSRENKWRYLFFSFIYIFKKLIHFSSNTLTKIWDRFNFFTDYLHYLEGDNPGM